MKLIIKNLLANFGKLNVNVNYTFCTPGDEPPLSNSVPPELMSASEFRPALSTQECLKNIYAKFLTFNIYVQLIIGYYQGVY